jgi:hypothetical protein
VDHLLFFIRSHPAFSFFSDWINALPFSLLALPIRPIFFHEKRSFVFFQEYIMVEAVITIKKGGVPVGKKMLHLLVIMLLVAAGNMYNYAKTKADSEQGIINSNGIHIRTGPGLNYSISQTASN